MRRRLPSRWRGQVIMQDNFGRTIDYLRISVTEACNFRCIYCAPNGFSAPHESPLSVAEIERIVRAAVALGITKIRLTGGEPLLRRDIVQIVQAIASVAGVQDLALTTNGFLLTRLARDLADAGLKRVNISLDTLRRDRFTDIVGVDAFDAVWAGIHAAQAAELAPIKINVVAMRGINDDEFADFARLTIEHPWHVRFIELMPVGVSDAARDFFNRHFISASELMARLPALSKSDAPQGSGPARTYRLPGAQATLGFITPASEHFCNACNRLRVTARGTLCACLFGERGEDARGALCEGVSEDKLQALLVRAIGSKPEQHPFGDDFKITSVDAMSKMGG
jgi:cyclic pyranopterin phosphate synthase